MKKYFTISAIGTDRPGIVADLAELVYECGCNLEDSNSTILENQFAHLMIISSPDGEAEKRLSTGCRRLELQKNLTVFFSMLEGVDWRRQKGAGSYWKLKAIGVDKAGIVWHLTRKLADFGLNIEQMETFTTPSADTGTPVFNMHVLLWGSPEVDMDRLQQEIDVLGNKLVIDVFIEPQDDQAPDRLK